MTAAGWIQLAVLIVLILGGTRLLGPYIAGIFTMPADAGRRARPAARRRVPPRHAVAVRDRRRCRPRRCAVAVADAPAPPRSSAR